MARRTRMTARTDIEADAVDDVLRRVARDLRVPTTDSASRVHASLELAGQVEGLRDDLVAGASPVDVLGLALNVLPDDEARYARAQVEALFAREVELGRGRGRLL